jgi:hypothetical protein
MSEWSKPQRIHLLVDIAGRFPMSGDVRTYCGKPRKDGRKQMDGLFFHSVWVVMNFLCEKSRGKGQG